MTAPVFPPNTSGVRWLIGTLLVAAAAIGCSQSGAPRPLAPEGANGAARVPTPVGASKRPGSAPRYPAIQPVTPIQGRVTFVNEKLRFVIVDFAFYQMPRLDQRLGMYREGKRVGEVRITGPANGSAIVADLMFGNAVPGDQVREE